MEKVTKAEPSGKVGKLHIRMNDFLRARLQARAEANHRSLNGEIIVCLEAALKAEGGSDGAAA